MLQHQCHSRHFQSRSHDKGLVLDCQLLILSVIHNHASLHWSATLTHQLETSLEDQRSRLCHKCGHCESSVNIAVFISISQKLAFSVCKCQIIEKHHSIFCKSNLHQKCKMVDNCTTQLKIKDFLHYSPLTVGKFIIICIEHTFTKYFF